MSFLFPKHKSRGFNLTPRFYDERAEERTRRFRKIDKELGDEKKAESENQNKSNRSDANFNFLDSLHRRKTIERQSSKRLIIFLLILFFLVYLFFFSGSLEGIVKILHK